MATKVLTGEILEPGAITKAPRTNGSANGFANLARDGEPHPVQRYLMSLKSERSVATQRSALAGALAAVGGKTLYDSTPEERAQAHELVYEFQWNKQSNADLEALQAALVHLGYAGNTVQRTMAAVRRVMKKCTKFSERSRWHMSHEAYVQAIDSDDWIKLDRNHGTTTGRCLTHDEIALLFDACRWRFRQGQSMNRTGDAEALTIRDRAVLALLFLRGLRVYELVNLNVGNYDSRRGEIKIVKSKTTSGKRVVPISGRAKLYLDDWLRIRGTTRGRVFCRVLKGGEVRALKNQRNSLSTNAIRKVLIKRCKLAGFPRCTTHDGRRTFITGALDAGVAPEVLRKIVGHASVEQTIAYTRYSAVERTAALEIVDAVQESIFKLDLPKAA